MKLWSKLSSLFRKGKLDREMSEEMRLHLEQRIEDNITAGMSVDEARCAAMRQFGGMEQFKEECRDQRVWVWLDQTASDFQQAVFSLSRTRTFTGVAVVTLALGIGACCAIYTVVNAVLLRPLDFPEPERLMVLQEKHPRIDSTSVSPANFKTWADHADLFESMAVRSDVWGNLVGLEVPVRVSIAGVTGKYFETLGLHAALGRVFGAAEDTAEKSNVVVFTHAFWQRHFGGRPEVIGSTIRLTGGNFDHVTVLGVLPPSVKIEGAEVIIPIGLPKELWQMKGRMFRMVVGRLKTGVSVDQARAQMDTIALRVAAQAPEAERDWRIELTPMLEFETKRVKPTLLALFAAAGMLLLIACTNLTNLLLVRATVRRREMAVRAALGASRGRIARQLLAESLVLAIVGGVLGVVVARWGLAGLLQFVPTDLPRADEIALDGRTIAITLGAALFLGLGVGVVPVWYGTRMVPSDALRGTNHGATDGRGPRLVRQALVIAQVGLALMLLTSAGLLIRSFARLSKADPGFRPDGAVMLWVYSDNIGATQQLAFINSVVERLQDLPGVSSAAATVMLPFSGNSVTRLFETEQQFIPASEQPSADFYPVTPDYFTAMGVPLLSGRSFTTRDGSDAPPVALINEAFAKRFFAGKEAIGQRIKVDGRNEGWREIVGVVADVRSNYHDESMLQIYAPFAQAPSGVVTFVVRAKGATTGLPDLLRRELRVLAPELPIFRMEALDQLIASSITRERFASILTGVFSVISLILAATGIYGVIAYSVAQRTREFGIRLAIGARPADLKRFVLAQGARLIGTGMVIGGAGALIATRLIESLLYETPARDPGVFGAVAVIFAGVALLACWLPAQRAARVDPMVALRCE